MDLLLLLTLSRDSIEVAEPPMWVHIILQLTIYGLIFYLGYRFALRKITMPYYNVLKHHRICELLASRDKEQVENLQKYGDEQDLPPPLKFLGDFSNAYFTERNSQQAINELEDHFVGKVIPESTHCKMLEAIDETFAEYQAEHNQSDNQPKTGNNYGNSQTGEAEATNASTS